MTDLSRREAIAAAAIVSFAAAFPALAQTAAKPMDAAAWDLTELYPDANAWDVARRQALEAVKGVAAYKGKLGESADTLARALTLQSDLYRTILRIYVYSSLKA